MAALDHDPEQLDVEELRHIAEDAAGEQLEGSVRRLIGIAIGLALLHLVEQPGDARIVLRHGDADAVELGEDVGAAALIGDKQSPPVAHCLRRHVLIGARVLLHGRDMDAAFVGEGRLADIGCAAVRRAIEQLIENARGVGERLELLRRHPGLEALRIVSLQQQCRDDGGEIGVAATLAEPVQRALDLAGAGAHRGERIGHAIVGVVMHMDADVVAGDVLHNLDHDPLDLLRQRAAIGVAQHHPAGAGLVGRLGAGKRVIGIGLVAVEEMLAVEQRLAPRGDDGRDQLSDGLQILLGADAERHIDMEVPGLGDETDGRRLRREHRLEAGIVGEIERPGRLVMPKAVSLANPSFCGAAKSFVSVGLAPGYPASI